MANQKVEKGCLGIQGIGHQQLEGSRVSLQHACSKRTAAATSSSTSSNKWIFSQRSISTTWRMVKLDPLSLRRVDGSLQTPVAGTTLMSIEHSDIPSLHVSQNLIPLQAPIHVLQLSAQSLIPQLWVHPPIVSGDCPSQCFQQEAPRTLSRHAGCPGDPSTDPEPIAAMDRWKCVGGDGHRKSLPGPPRRAQRSFLCSGSVVGKPAYSFLSCRRCHSKSESSSINFAISW